MQELEKHWKVWIAENLAYGTSAATLADALASYGIPLELAEHEVETARRHPYVEGARKVAEMYTKRNWLLKSWVELGELDPGFPHVDIINADQVPPYEVFLRDYVAKSRPVLMKGAAKHWKAMEWDFDYLLKKVGDVEIEVQDGRDNSKDTEATKAEHKTNMKFSTFLDRIREAGVSNNLYLTAYNSSGTTDKIWPLFADYDNIGDGYIDKDETALRSRTSLWMGPAGTRTPMHYDSVNNMFVQLIGKKKVYLIHPYYLPYTYNFRYVFSEIVDLENYDRAAYPDMEKVKPIELIVEAGDMLFIPLGWFHFVVSLEVSLTHTFLNFKDINNKFPGLHMSDMPKVGE